MAGYMPEPPLRRHDFDADTQSRVVAYRTHLRHLRRARPAAPAKPLGDGATSSPERPLAGARSAREEQEQWLGSAASQSSMPLRTPRLSSIHRMKPTSNSLTPNCADRHSSKPGAMANSPAFQRRFAMKSGATGSRFKGMSSSYRAIFSLSTLYLSTALGGACRIASTNVARGWLRGRAWRCCFIRASAAASRAAKRQESIADSDGARFRRRKSGGLPKRTQGCPF
mmetsp:Transcript_41198/g.119298  ORF Transcript_41198/g.119298 Transcript_41198/m.119298 type:complete len:226 (-) Transcript_41198:16-693(-)